MPTIRGYDVAEKLHDSQNSVIFRAVRVEDDASVVIKVLNKEHPSARELARFRLEYDLIRGFTSDGIIKAHDFLVNGKAHMIIVEDFGGVSLDRILANNGHLPIDQFLPPAIRACGILAEIHAQRIIHKDINPANIVWNRDTGAVKIIDFGISTNLRLEKTTQLEGTLDYISPEQTGRMNRRLDYRTDLYSLGATFYRMLTGQVLFCSDDSIELVHGHIAKTPVPPNRVRDDIPEVISDIIVKLLAKKAEDRYGSALGVQADLQTCLQHLGETGAVSAFAIGERDWAGVLNIPEKLYGREHEVNQLLSTFQEACAGSRVLLLITGHSGIGKSSLVNEIQKPLVAKRGHFVSGKYDQFSRGTPYVALSQAFEELVRQILTEPEERVAAWREKIQKAVGASGRLLTEVAPGFELLIGKQASIPDLPPVEAQNRFNGLFQSVIATVATAEHPLVLFIDDLQWADLPSLALIELVLKSAATRYVSVVGAYRDNEVATGHPLLSTLKRLDAVVADDLTKKTIELRPLELEHVQELISDAMPGEQKGNLDEFARLCLRKTGGNPFFVGQFVSHLADEQLIFFDAAAHAWDWNLQEIAHTQATDNVVDLMVGKIHKLPEETQRSITLAALIGNKFDLDTLAVVNEKTRTACNDALVPALREGFVLPLDDSYKFVADDNTDHVGFRFLHDRVQQAAYSLMPEEEIRPVNLEIGRLLLGTVAEAKREDRIFEILDHINQGKELITDLGERNDIVDHNLLAGKKAKAAAAYNPAVSYLQHGIDLIDAEESWRTHYERTLDLYTQAAQCSDLNGDNERLEFYSKCVVDHAAEDLDKVPIYEIGIRESAANLNPKQAVKRSVDLLRLLGIRFPYKVSKPKLILDLLKTKRALRGRTTEDLLALPVLTDRYWAKIMDVLLRMSLPAYHTDKGIYLLCVFLRIRLTLRYGNAPASLSGYIGYGIVQCAVFGNIDYGYQLGKLALALLEKVKDASSIGRTHNFYNINLRHWREPLRNCLPGLMDAHHHAMENGDLESGSTALLNHGCFALHAGEELVRFAETRRGFEHIFVEANNPSGLEGNRCYIQVALNLINRVEKPHILAGDAYNEHQQLAIYKDTQYDTYAYIVYINKVYLAYLFGLLPEALEYLREGKLRRAGGVLSLFMDTLLPFYESLVLLAALPSFAATKRWRALRTVRANQRKIRTWAEHSAANHLHKWHLIEAELARVRGNLWRAEHCYQNAIEMACKHDFVHEEALANELAADFHLQQGHATLARMLMNEAVYCYQKWGAAAKVEQLSEKYPQLLMLAAGEWGSTGEATVATTGRRRSTTSQSGSSLDFTSMIKAARIISGEIVMEQLLPKLMRILMENAGGQRGSLILEDKGQYWVHAEGLADSSDVRVIEPTLVEEATSVPASLVQFVARTKEPFVLSDAREVNQFSQDPYIVKQRPQSVLCMPLLNKGTVIGLIYLENDLTSGAFTPERLEIVRVLSAQVATSIDNARLYERLKRANVELRHQVASRSERLYSALELISRGAEAGIAELQPGEVVDDRYRVVQKIGSGAMGAVYEIERLSDGRHAALKVALHLNAMSLARLAREAKVVAQVAHPNVVSVLDVEVAKGGFLYVVMEFLDGTSLAQNEARFGDVRWALGVLTQVAAGLAALHREGVVHRDIKPANIMVAGTNAGHAPLVKIIDFGISQMEVFKRTNAAAPDENAADMTLLADTRVDDRDSAEPLQLSDPLSATPTTLKHKSLGTLIGTPWYMPPELCDGEKMISLATDTFAFGVVAFEILAGKMPFKNPMFLAALNGKELPTLRKLSQLAPGLDETLASVIERCLAVESSVRPSFEEIAPALKRSCP